MKEAGEKGNKCDRHPNAKPFHWHIAAKSGRSSRSGRKGTTWGNLATSENTLRKEKKGASNAVWSEKKKKVLVNKIHKKKRKGGETCRERRWPSGRRSQ